MIEEINKQGIFSTGFQTTTFDSHFLSIANAQARNMTNSNNSTIRTSTIGLINQGIYKLKYISYLECIIHHKIDVHGHECVTILPIN